MNPLDPPATGAPEEPAANPVTPSPQPELTPTAPAEPVAQPPSPPVTTPVSAPGVPAPTPPGPELQTTPQQPAAIVTGGDPTFTAPSVSPKKSKKKLILIIVAVVVLLALLVGGFFGFMAFSKSQNEKAAKSAAATFMDGYITGDAAKVKSVYGGEDFNENDFDGGSEAFERADYIDAVIGKQDGHDKAVIAYKLPLKEKLKALGGDAFYIMLILHKDEGKWMIEDGVPSLTEPKVKLDVEASSGPDITNSKAGM